MDDGSRSSWIVIVVVLIVMACIFAVCETAFASVSRIKLKTRADKGDVGAKRALYVTQHFDRAITTLLICTNIVHLAAASVVTVNVTRIFGLSAVTVSTLITTLVVFFFGEMLPKSVARKYSESISVATAGMLSVLMFIFKPASSLLSLIGNKISALTDRDSETTVTEGELYDIIDDMTEEGTLDEVQGDLISSALSFGTVTVETILTPRMDIAAVDISMSPEDILAYINSQNHSRLPVYEGSIDRVVGILQIRKFIKAYIREKENLDVRSLLSDPYFIHQSTKIDDLLKVMSREKLNIAIVTDNYGGTLGLVSVEDILEELVGEIWDEDDREVENIIRLSDTTYSVNAQEHVIDVLEELDIPFSLEDEEKIENKLMSEFAYESFSEIPKEGDSFKYLNLEISVISMKLNRIVRLRVRILPKEEEESGVKTDIEDKK